MKDIIYKIAEFFTTPEQALRFANNFEADFITDDRWTWLVEGLGVTIKLTFFAFILGLLIGMVIAVVRVSYDRRIDTPTQSTSQKIGRSVLGFFNAICKLYLNIIQGTPTIVQIMMIYFVILVNSTNKVGVAILGFTINSSAYVAEIIRGGINGVDKGQMEAGRSLGYGYVSTKI